MGNCHFLASTLLDSTWSTVADLIISDGSELVRHSDGLVHKGQMDSDQKGQIYSEPAACRSLAFSDIFLNLKSDRFIAVSRPLGPFARCN